MAQYLLTVYQPDEGTPPPETLSTIMAEVEAWRAELQSAGAWVFTAGLEPPDAAAVVRFADGDLLTTDGPFAEGKEHAGGFTVVTAPDRAAALAWAGKLAPIVTPLSIEVRELRGKVG
jgi:hypothetical protein